MPRVESRPRRYARRDDHERGVVVIAIFGPEPGGPVVLAAGGKRGAVERVYSRAIRRFKSEVHRRPDRVTADEPEIVSASCLHTYPLLRLKRDLVAERRECRFEETAAGIHVGDVDRNVVEHRSSSLLDWSRTAPSERHASPCECSALVQILDAVTRGGREWKHPSTEARQLAEEVVSEIRRLRPRWIRRFPETSKVQRLEKFWTKTIWQQAAADPHGVADRVNAGWEMDEADRVVFEDEQQNREALMRSGARREWEIEPHVDLSNHLEGVRLGWNGARLAYWRVDSAMAWWEIALHGASGRVPLHGSLHDWLDPWIRSDRIRNERESWNRFWYYEVEAERTPRNWMTALGPWAQILRKLGQGNPRDVQHAAYLYDADVFFTADRLYRDSLEHLRPWSPTDFARTALLSGTEPIVPQIDAELNGTSGAHAPR